MRPAAAVIANRAGHGTGMVMRPTGTRRLAARAAAVGHIVIGRA